MFGAWTLICHIPSYVEEFWDPTGRAGNGVWCSKVSGEAYVKILYSCERARTMSQRLSSPVLAE